MAETAEKLAGRLIGIRGGDLAGWAWNPAGPDAAESVEVFIDGKFAKALCAGEYRKNLERRGFGSGQHGFRFPVPRDVFDDEEHTFSVRFAASGDELPGSPLSVKCERGSVPALSHPPYRGAPSHGKAMTLIGKEGWPFLCNTRTMDQLVGRTRLSDQQLKTFHRTFVARRERFRELDIPYLFATAPMKELIYREFLPAGLRLSTEPFPLDQLLELFRGEQGIDILDLRPILLEAKRKERIYYRTDTHCNMLGGYHLYRALVKEASRSVAGLAPRNISDFAFVEVPAFRGDLADKIKMTVKNNRLVPCDPSFDDPTLYDERVMHVDPSCLRAQELDEGEVPKEYQVSRTRKTRIFEIPDAVHLPTAVVVRDSFAEQVIPYLSEHFRRTTYVWVPNPPFSVIRKEQPDVVIQLMAERFLIRSPLSLDWDLEREARSDTRLRASDSQR